MVSSIAGGSRKQELVSSQQARCHREHNHLHRLNTLIAMKPVMQRNCESYICFTLVVGTNVRGNRFSKKDDDASWVSSLPRPTSPPARVTRRQSVVQAINGQDNSNHRQIDTVKLGSATSPANLELLRDVESSECMMLRKTGIFILRLQNCVKRKQH